MQDEERQAHDHRPQDAGDQVTGKNPYNRDGVSITADGQGRNRRPPTAKTLHISIKYIVEISIIAPAIELIFAPQGQELWLTAILGLFALANLVIYLFYRDKLIESDREMMAEKTIG